MKNRALALLIASAGLGFVTACGSSQGSPAERLQNGDRLLSENKLPEALVEYRAAVQADDRNAEARRKLGKALAQAGDVGRATEQLVRAADLLPDDAGAQLEAARALLLAGQFEDARTRADGVLKRDNKNVLAHVVRATASAGLRETDSALTSLATAVKLDPNRGATYMDLATLQASAGQNAEAEAGFKQAVTVAPKSVDAYLALAGYYWRTSRAKEAEATLTTAVALDPKHVPANLALFNLLRGTGRPAEAEAPLKRAVESAPTNLSLRLGLADYYVEQKRYPDAQAILQELGKEPSAAAAAGGRLAAVEYELNKPESAHKLLDDLIKKQPGNAQLLTLKGNWRLREKRIDDASQAAQAALKADPQSAEANYLLGSVYLQRNNFDEAERAFTEALRLRPGATDAQVALANLNSARGRPEAALTLARRAAEAAPADATARYTLARALFVSGNTEAARRELQPVLTAAPESPEVLTLWGRIQEKTGDVAGARQSYAKALDLDPAGPDALVPLINMDLAAKRPADATKRIEAQLAKAGSDPQVLLIAGRTYAATGDLAKSEAALRKAIDTDPSLMEGYHVLGQILVRQKKLDEAIKAYTERVAERPTDIGAQTMVGMIQIVQGKRTDARATFEKVLSADPRAAVASNNLAYMDAEAGTNLDVALNRAQTAKAALPDDPDVNDTLGWVYVKRGLPALAISPLEQALQKNPNQPTYHYHLGMAHVAGGDKDRARLSLQKALQLSKSFEGASDAQRALDALGR